MRLNKNWLKIEKELMQALGLRPQPGSGSHWLLKEDGESEKFLAQLKSTDAKSIKVDNQTMRDLVYNARIAHKIPILVLNFTNGYTLLAVRIEDAERFAREVSSLESNIHRSL